MNLTRLPAASTLPAQPSAAPAPAPSAASASPGATDGPAPRPQARGLSSPAGRQAPPARASVPAADPSPGVVWRASFESTTTLGSVDSIPANPSRANTIVQSATPQPAAQPAPVLRPPSPGSAAAWLLQVRAAEANDVTAFDRSVDNLKLFPASGRGRGRDLLLTAARSGADEVVAFLLKQAGVHGRRAALQAASDALSRHVQGGGDADQADRLRRTIELCQDSRARHVADHLPGPLAQMVNFFEKKRL